MISLKNIVKTYVVWEQEIDVLKWVSLEIKEWEFVAIMWPSWSGKSTLMNIIWMLDTPTSWEYLLDGENVESLSEDDQSHIRWRKIGFVFQSYNLIPRLNITKQVALPLIYQWFNKKQREERAVQSLTKLWLWEKINTSPKELSGGQQQRVSIARAIVINPSLILADEPTGALDTKTSEEVMNIFQDLHKEWRTIVMITHEPDIAKFAERTIHIRDGNIFE